MLIAVFLRGRSVEVIPGESAGKQDDGRIISALRGEKCAYGASRPYAVMLAEDAVARPLAGIASADVVVEMPVLSGGINRMMALYQCERPSEIGSVRSARHDFIPLAAGFDAIFAHWGGSYTALSELSEGVIDNIDALPNPFSAFWRKLGVSAPHNGFTSWERLSRAAEGLGYRTDSHAFGGWSRKDPEYVSESGILRIAYPAVVSYQYDSERGTYLRYRANLRERDALTQKQAEADVVAVLYAVSRQISPDYNDVDIEGEGELAVFQEGREYRGVWQKRVEDVASPLVFLDDQGNSMSLIPGTLWIQIVEPGTSVIYSSR